MARNKSKVELHLRAVEKRLEGNKELGQARWKVEEVIVVSEDAFHKRWKKAVSILLTGRLPKEKKEVVEKKEGKEYALEPTTEE